jgi:hypothetical protein
MELNRIVAGAVIAAVIWTTIPLKAEEHEGVLVAKPVLASRSIGSGMMAADPQLVQLPSPVYPMPTQRISMRAWAWTVMSVGALAAYVRVTTPTR